MDVYTEVHLTQYSCRTAKIDPPPSCKLLATNLLFSNESMFIIVTSCLEIASQQDMVLYKPLCLRHTQLYTTHT